MVIVIVVMFVVDIDGDIIIIVVVINDVSLVSQIQTKAILHYRFKLFPKPLVAVLVALVAL